MRPGTYRSYVLVLLTSIMVFNYVDRLAMGLMLQDIKADLQVSDTQLGFLTGIAFALFYAVMGIPIARWADRGNRVTIISVTVGLWSIAVALCAAAASFFQLLIFRIGVAVGEAGCHPPAFSLLADYFARNDRPRAIARYMLGWPLALSFGFFAAGWLNQLYGWRLTFVILGVPGLSLAALAHFSLREPRETPVAAAQGIGEGAREAHPQPGIGTVMATFWNNRTFRHLLFAFSLSYFFGNGILQWQPAFFMRSHTMATGEIGTWFALIYGIGGLLGTFVGGELASRYAANNERRQLLGMAVLYVVHALLGSAVYLAPERHIALGLLALSAIGNAMVAGPMFAATQTIVPREMRAMSIAVVLFFSNLIGLGFGPLAAGALSDGLRSVFGEESLRYALLFLCPGYFWCTWHFWRASRTVAEDVNAAQRRSSTESFPLEERAARVHA